MISSEFDERYRPSDDQMQIVIDNCQYVIGGDKKLGTGALFKLMEGFGNPRELIALFLIHTCDLGLD